jgi:hypothetical protein
VLALDRSSASKVARVDLVERKVEQFSAIRSSSLCISAKFFSDKALGVRRAGDDGIWNALNALGGDEDRVKISGEAILNPVLQNLRPTQIEAIYGHDTVAASAANHMRNCVATNSLPKASATCA